MRRAVPLAPHPHPHYRPVYNILSVEAEGREVPIVEGTVLTLHFGSLLHFRKSGGSLPTQPAVLLVAPLSGHFANLLRKTARTLLQDLDVYITDWHNARDVSLRNGGFSLDDHITEMMRFTETIGPGVHMVAACQPCVAATAIRAEDDNPAQPSSLTLMTGQVDCRVNPTGVNELATSKPIERFEKNLISRVPFPQKGFMRRVYPGFVQLSAFISMNPERHKQPFRNICDHLESGCTQEAATIQNFYEEDLAVNDSPAEFYLETVEQVFQTCDLPRGVWQYLGLTVNPAAIRRTALMRSKANAMTSARWAKPLPHKTCAAACNPSARPSTCSLTSVTAASSTAAVGTS